MTRPVDCQSFEILCDDLPDPRLDAALQASLIAHQAQCARCADFALHSRHQRRVLRSLAPKPVPVQVAVSLRVLASKERARRESQLTWGARFDAFQTRARLWLDNLWRPLAIPTAGGLVSACILFAALMPTFALHGTGGADVPTAWYQSAEVYGLSPFGGDFENVTLDVRIDTSGRVIDYAAPSGDRDRLEGNPQMRKAVENSLLFMTFKPASFFGQPASDTIRITLRRSHIEVKG